MRDDAVLGRALPLDLLQLPLLVCL